MKKIIILFLFSIFLISACAKDGSIEKDFTAANKQVTGSSANDLLSDNIFVSLVIELVYVEGFKPTVATITGFKSFLQDRINKPNGITVEMRSIPSPGKSPYSLQEIVEIESIHRTKYNTGDKIAIWAFFADGESDNNSKTEVVLGSAYWNTSFVIYEETVHSFSDSELEPSRDILETTVIIHEFGHLLGLTNLGTEMQSEHEDAAHEKHCDVADCLMYWSAETGAGAKKMKAGGVVPQLDAQCLADLQANGGK